MKKYTSLLLLMVFSLSAFSQTADEIIEKYVKAVGGREKYKSINSIRSTGVNKGGSIDIQSVSIQTASGSQRSETTIMGMTSINAFDAKTKTGWYISPFQGDKSAHKMNDEQTKGYLENPRLEPILMIYKDLGATADYLGKEDFEGVDVHLIMLTMADKSIHYYYIDAETFLILKEMTKQKFEDKEQEFEVYYYDYRTVDGITMAYTSEGHSEGQVTWQYNVTKVEFNVPVDDSLFIMPKQ